MKYDNALMSGLSRQAVIANGETEHSIRGDEARDLLQMKQQNSGMVCGLLCVCLVAVSASVRLMPACRCDSIRVKYNTGGSYV